MICRCLNANSLFNPELKYLIYSLICFVIVKEAHWAELTKNKKMKKHQRQLAKQVSNASSPKLVKQLTDQHKLLSFLLVIQLLIVFENNLEVIRSFFL